MASGAFEVGAIIAEERRFVFLENIDIKSFHMIWTDDPLGDCKVLRTEIHVDDSQMRSSFVPHCHKHPDAERGGFHVDRHSSRHLDSRQKELAERSADVTQAQIS